MSSLVVNDVTFGYGRGRPVLRSFACEFASGSTLLLGPNGAGKSTLLGLCASVLAPRSGFVATGDLRAAGSSLRRFRAQLSFMPQQIQPIPGLTVHEQVAYVGWLKGMSRPAAWQRARLALERTGLGELRERRPRSLSGGELRRLGVAQTLVNEARWVLMDEPTAGLDPAQRADFQSIVADLRGEVNLVISTHQTDDIDTNYDWVVVLGEGTVRFADTTERFLALGDGPAGSSEQVVSAYQRALDGSDARS